MPFGIAARTWVSDDHQKSWLPRTIILRPGSAPTARISSIASASVIAQLKSPGSSTISSPLTFARQSSHMRSKWFSQCAPNTSIGFISEPGKCRSPIA